MRFKFVDLVIKNLSLNLEVLIKDSNLYSTLLYQHRGTFTTEETRFGNHEDCTLKFNSFLSLAQSENVALAMTPEYSCPWNSIDWFLSDEARWPNPGKLWAICCESITPLQIISFRDRFENTKLHFHFDEAAFNNGNGILLDPLCYIFRAQIDGIDKLVVLIQFKTQHMGVWESNAEQAKYIWGNEIYILRNSPNSIFLFTNICSEAVEFKIDTAFQEQVDNRWDEFPYIILSPQMNPKPTHDSFKTFRKAILNYNLKDIISLNWGGGTMYHGNGKPLIHLSKSSIIIKSDQAEYSNEARYIKNHNKGLYYLLRKPNIQVNYLHPSTDVFLIVNQKPSSAGINSAMVRRIGPEVTKVFMWNIGNGGFSEVQSIPDGFIDFLNSLHCANSMCHNISINFIDKERLVNISTGQVTTKQEDRRWYNIDKLESLFQNEDESVKRFTYVHDESSIDLRTNYVEVLDILNNQILPNPVLFPTNLSSFVNNCSEVMFFNDEGYNYKYNLVTKDRRHTATIAYIGRKDEATALRILQRLQNIFEKGDQSRKLVVIWYKENAVNIIPVCDPKPPRVNDDTILEPNSIY